MVDDVGTPGKGANNPLRAHPLGSITGNQPSRPLTVDYTHVVNVAAAVQLLRHFDLGFNFSY
jgi:hypothetical protein